MRTTSLHVPTADGPAPAALCRPDHDAPCPAVLFHPDAGSLRESMRAMAGRLADAGFVVLVPDVYHREGAWAPFDARTMFDDPPERARLMGLMDRLTTPQVLADAGAFLAALLGDAQVLPGSRAGLVGYCMGGRHAIQVAAAHADKVGAAASIHGGGLVTDAPNSPHLGAPMIRAQLYFAVADEDRSCTPAHQATLQQALDAHGVRYAMERYAGARHGFAVPDMPTFDAAAAERHWTQTIAVLREGLAAAP